MAEEMGSVLKTLNQRIMDLEEENQRLHNFVKVAYDAAKLIVDIVEGKQPEVKE